MALLGSINIGDRDSAFSSGAAFLLSKNSRVSELRQLSKDALLEVKPNVNYAVVRFKNAATPQEALELGHELIQQGLDLLSILGIDDLTIRDAGDEHLIWWREGSLQILRVVSTSTLNFDVPPVQLIVRDKEGNEIKTPQIEPTYHEAFRFFRLSQLTEDLYDAYRNMYLAFELLLSSKWPIKKKEREIDWLYRGISKAHASLDFSGFVSTPDNNLIKSIIQTVYYNARLPLFHAKQGRGFYPPQSSENRQSVKNALEILTKIVLKLSESYYNARRLGGGVFAKWVYENAIQLYASAKMLMSDDDSKFDPANADLSHRRYKTAAWLNTQILPVDSNNGKGPVIIGSIGKNNFGDLEYVHRFEVVNERAPLLVHVMENAIKLAGIDRLEGQFDTRVSNVRQPKNLFPR